MDLLCSRNKPEMSFHQAFASVKQEMPEDYFAWTELERIWPAAVTILSIESKARQGAQSLLKAAEKLSPHHIVDNELSLLLAVLDDEPVVIIEPATKRGVEGLMSGVATNEQLHVLVMELLLNADAHVDYGLTEEALAVAHGVGPQEVPCRVYLEWSMYIWKGLAPDKTLPESNDMSDKGLWIWDIDTPADIPTLNGHRIILLGEPHYARYWKGRRSFDLLRANIELTKELTSNEADEWLERIVAQLSNK